MKIAGKYTQVANQINNLIPNLPIRVSVHHISTAHPLPTKSKKSNVVVVRFANRYIKDMIYKYRHLVSLYFKPSSTDISAALSFQI